MKHATSQSRNADFSGEARRQEENRSRTGRRDMLAGAIDRALGQDSKLLQAPAASLAGLEDKQSSQEFVPDAKTIRQWIKRAERGNSLAQYNLGVAYANGQGVAQDYAEAVKWYRKAAEQGYVNAQNNLGAAYANAQGVTQDYSEAVKWFRKAAEQGNTNAQTNIGITYKIGKGVAIDYTEAIYWFNKAAHQGHVGAQNNLGILYYAQKKYKDALVWLTPSSEQESSTAQLLLSLFYHSSYAVDKNATTALFWLHKTAANWLAKNDLQLESEDQELIDYLHQQAKQGIKPAQVILYFMYRDGNGVAQNTQTALDWLEQAARQDDPLGRYALGRVYMEGKLRPADAGKARAEFEKIIHALEQKDKILTHFSAAGLSEQGIQPNADEAETYPRNVKQWLVLLAQTKLNELQALETQEELKKSKQELEDIQAMLAHKFRGALRAIRYNLEYDQPVQLSLVQTDTMNGLLEIFSLISHDNATLRERLRQDNQGDNRGEGTLPGTLQKALSSALAQLLVIERMDDIIQHYLAYAIRSGALPAETTRRALRHDEDCHQVWQKLQNTWQAQWYAQAPELEAFRAWVAERFFGLQLEGFHESPLRFSPYGIKESLLLVVMTEVLMNVFKYYSSPDAEAVRLSWSKTEDSYVLACDNPTSPQEKRKGSAKGHKFLKVIADKLEGHFQEFAGDERYRVAFTLPAGLFD